ncbi:MAG: metallophosphoesterase family protein [Pirellulales bacterium]
MSHNGSEDLPKRGVTPTSSEAALARAPGSTEPSTCAATARVIAIGDVHGCVHALDTLLEAIAPRSDDCIVQLGDFVDSGRDTRDVIDTLLALQSNCRLVTLMGNHEEMLLGALENDRLRDVWLMCGGVDTLNSYRFGAGIDVLPDAHLALIRSGLDSFETATHAFLHANYDARLPFSRQPPYVLRWTPLDLPGPGPHCSGKSVVVGHTEQQDGEILDLEYVRCIDTACHRNGWLTALEVTSGQVWQASRWGVLREP